MDTRPKLTVAADGLIAGDAALLSRVKKELTLDNPKYQDAKKYGRWVGKRMPSKLKFYKEMATGISFPRGFVNEVVRICRAQQGIDPEIIDQRTVLPEIALKFCGTLREYQHKAVEEMQKRQFGVLEAGTGSGKTVIALAVIAGHRQPALILVHTKELLYQWQKRIEEFLGIQAGLFGDGNSERRPVTVAIVNTARKRLDLLTDYFGLICVDECHRVPASLFTDVVTAFNCRYMIGLSATAFRRDGLSKLINIYLGDLVHRIDQDELQESGAVLKPEYIQQKTEFSWQYRDDYQALLKALTKDEQRNQQIVDDISREYFQKQGVILVVSDRVIHCDLLAELLAANNIEAAVLTGRTSSEERNALVEAVHQGDVAVLISTIQLIGEGFDCPGLTTLFLTTPIKFSGRLLQVVGRVLRPAPGKTAKVYDYDDVNIGMLKRSAQQRQMTFR